MPTCMRKRALSQTELSRFRLRVEQSGADLKLCLLAIMADTGCRADEALKLTGEDFSSDYTVVNLKLPSKGSQPGQYKLTHSTSKLLCASLRAANPANTLSHHIWPTRKLRARYNGLLDYWTRLRIHLMDEGSSAVGLHCFRHTVAQLYYEETKDILALQAVLRHKSDRSTRHYLPTINFNKVRDQLWLIMK